VDDLTQKYCRLNIGCPFYLVKLSRPDLSNPVRQLLKVMDGAASGHVKELKRLIQFVQSTKGVVLKMQFQKKSRGKSKRLAIATMLETNNREKA
jgi:hypothetical protein